MSFSDIFSVKSLDKAVDGIYNGADMLYYTDEEKAKAEQLKRDTKLEMLKLYHPYKLAQRVIAFAFTFNFLLAFWVGVLLYLVFPTYFDGFLNLVDRFNIGWIMLAIVSFYFTDGAMSWFKGGKK